MSKQILIAPGLTVPSHPSSFHSEIIPSKLWCPEKKEFNPKKRNKNESQTTDIKENNLTIPKPKKRRKL